MPDASIEFVGGWSRLGEPDWVGKTLDLGGHNVSAAVFETGQPGRRSDPGRCHRAHRGRSRERGAVIGGSTNQGGGSAGGVMIVASVHAE